MWNGGSLWSSSSFLSISSVLFGPNPSWGWKGFIGWLMYWLRLFGMISSIGSCFSFLMSVLGGLHFISLGFKILKEGCWIGSSWMTWNFADPKDRIFSFSPSLDGCLFSSNLLTLGWVFGSFSTTTDGIVTWTFFKWLRRSFLLPKTISHWLQVPSSWINWISSSWISSWIFSVISGSSNSGSSKSGSSKSGTIYSGTSSPTTITSSSSDFSCLTKTGSLPVNVEDEST